MNGARIARLRSVINDLEKRAFLHLEVGVVRIVCEPLIQTTFTLEGNGCAALIAYDQLQEMYNWLDMYTPTCNFPGMEYVIQRCVTSLKLIPWGRFAAIDQNAVTTQITEYVHRMVEGATDYYRRTIIVKLSADMKIYEACRFVNPISTRLQAGLAGGAAELQVPPNFTELIAAFGHPPDRLQNAPHRFSTAQIAAMKKEWPAYVKLCCLMPVSDLDATPDHIMFRATEFWNVARTSLPNLAKLARYAFTIVPSSASAERVFSLLKRYFSLLSMNKALTDYTAGSCMLQYNRNTTGVKNS